MPTPSCYTINQQLSLESGRIGLTARTRWALSSPWLTLPKQEAWPDEMGYTLTSQIVERSLPTGTQTWTDITSADSCIPSKTTVTPAYTNRTYSRQETAIESDPLCLEHIRAAHDMVEQINMRVDNLVDNVKRVWIDYKRDAYFASSGHKVVVAAGLPESSGSGFPLTQPTSNLTMGVLNNAFVNLQYDGGTESGAVARVGGSPVMVLVAGSQTINSLIKNNDDIRQDLRWSSEADLLIKPWGITKAYGNFIFMPDVLPPRYNWTGSAFVRVSPYTSTAATFGSSAEIASAYKNAQFEASFLFHPDVFTQLNPNPNIKAGKAVYTAQNYNGDYRWINKFDKECNPDENIGYFRAKLSAAVKPVQPRYGYAFLHLRCADDNAFLACPAGSGYIS